MKSLLEQLGFSATGPEPPAGSWDPSEPKGTSSHTARVWVEKTIVKGRQDRQTGAHRVGEALVSPQKAADGRDIYANMRDVRLVTWSCTSQITRHSPECRGSRQLWMPHLRG